MASTTNNRRLPPTIGRQCGKQTGCYMPVMGKSAEPTIPPKPSIPNQAARSNHGIGEASGCGGHQSGHQRLCAERPNGGRISSSHLDLEILEDPSVTGEAMIVMLLLLSLKWWLLIRCFWCLIMIASCCCCNGGVISLIQLSGLRFDNSNSDIKQIDSGLIWPNNQVMSLSPSNVLTEFSHGIWVCFGHAYFHL